MRRAIATQMTKALQIPVAYTVVEVDMSGVVALRDSAKTGYQAQEGIGLTFDAFVAKATVEALKRHADFNAHYTDEGHWRRQQIGLGIAVAVEDGLVVPVVKDADRLSVHGLNRQIRDLADKARAGKLEPDDVAASTFTITNPGPFGSFMSAPIINVPNTGILSTDTVAKRPTVITNEEGQDMIAIRHIGYLGLTWDHRAFDGSTAVLLLRKIKENLETWDWEQELS